jgi:hypothetical protein
MSVYFIEAPNGLVKIGFSTNPWQRLGKMKVDCPDELILRSFVDGGISEERAFHQRFCSFHVRGEWFRLQGELRDFIDSLPPAERLGRKRTSDTALAIYREKRGLTQDEMGDLLGISRFRYLRLEKGDYVPTPEEIYLIDMISAGQVTLEHWAEEYAALTARKAKRDEIHLERAA